jgi:hypothetical protein
MNQGIKECCDWLECQLSDIKTFLAGIQKHIEGDKIKFPGGGNLSVPILIYAYLEFISALYCGKAEEISKKTSKKKKNDKCNRTNTDYNATNNVKLFVEKFFPDDYKKYPLLFWDGIRNAVTHHFSPKAMTTQVDGVTYVIHFQFYVEDNNIPAHAKNINNQILINVNDFELFAVIQEATKDYFSVLEYDEELQRKCLKVWQEIKAYERDISSDKDKNGEAQRLISAIEKQAGKYCFRK